jgi:c-di-GMP-binding flagellar brake protein YcgR
VTLVQNRSKSPQERREFFRLNFKKPLEFKSVAATPGETVSLRGTSQNISQTGILFQTEKNPPSLSSILWMNLDLRTLSICQEIEDSAVIFKDGLLGKVVRVEEDPKNQDVYDVGVCFLTQDERNSREVERFLSQIAASQN